MTRTCVACLAGALVLLASAARSEPAPCLVSATLPERAFVGEQIVLRLRILRRPDVSAATWVDGPALPGFRADALPGSSGERRVQEQGATYLVFEERRALFPVRAGRLEVSAARLRCTLHALPGEPARSFVATLAARHVDATAPPANGRPEGDRGLVGVVRAELRAEPRRLSVGESVRVEVALEGEADLRDAPEPFGGAREIGGAELFAARPLLRAEPAERLRFRRTQSFELVPRRSGILTLPPTRISYFDPRSGHYGVATTEPVEIHVDPPGGG